MGRTRLPADKDLSRKTLDFLSLQDLLKLIRHNSGKLVDLVKAHISLKLGITFDDFINLMNELPGHLRNLVLDKVYPYRGNPGIVRATDIARILGLNWQERQVELLTPEQVSQINYDVLVLLLSDNAAALRSGIDPNKIAGMGLEEFLNYREQHDSQNSVSGGGVFSHKTPFVTTDPDKSCASKKRQRL